MLLTVVNKIDSIEKSWFKSFVCRCWPRKL